MEKLAYSWVEIGVGAKQRKKDCVSDISGIYSEQRRWRPN